MRYKKCDMDCKNEHFCCQSSECWECECPCFDPCRPECCPQRVTGPAGPEGKCGPQNSLTSANDNDTAVSANGTLSFYQNLSSTGTAITHTPGSPFFEITEPGIYEVYYQTNVSVPSAPSYPVTAETMIVFDGDTLPHTQDSAMVSSNADTEPLSGFGVFYAASASSLFLKNSLGGTHFNDSILMINKLS